MEKVLKVKRFVVKNGVFCLPGYGVVFLLFSPFVWFCFRLNSIDWWFLDTGFPFVFCMTLLQAGTAGFLSVFLALLGSRGMLFFALFCKKHYLWIEAFVLLPCLVPSLLLVISFVHFIELFMPFRFGLTALIVTQVLTYTGLCTVALSRVILKEVSGLSQWAYVHGSSSFLFLKTLCFGLLAKDIKVLFVLVFVSCFTSLSLPVLVSGSSKWSLEFFIYENLKDPQNWPTALSLILLQSLFVFFICWRAFSSSFYTDRGYDKDHKSIYLLPKVAFAFIPLGLVCVCFAGLFFISDFKSIAKLLPLTAFILLSSLYSLVLSLGVGMFVLLFLLLMCVSYQNVKVRKFVVSFTPPGVSFMGFAALSLPLEGVYFVLLKWVLGLSLLLFPFLYRFRGERALERLSSQVEVARFLGADWILIFRQILWPQCRSVFFLCAGIASFLACGDFAYSLIVSGNLWSLALVVYDVFSSYRLDEAVILSWLWLILSFFVFAFWMGVDFVFSGKFILSNR